jgi:hypothetical protein
MGPADCPKTRAQKPRRLPKKKKKKREKPRRLYFSYSFVQSFPAWHSPEINFLNYTIFTRK